MYTKYLEMKKTTVLDTYSGDRLFCVFPKMEKFSINKTFVLIVGLVF